MPSDFEATVSGHTLDLLFDTSGKIVEVEEDVSIDVVPARVTAALGASGKVPRVEMLTTGANVTDEAQIKKTGHAAGTRVKR
jgi:hypothetical protein